VPRGSLEIGVYEPPISRAAEHDGSPRSESRGRYRATNLAAARYGASTVGALASLLLHTLLITGLVWGGGHSRAPSPPLPDRGAAGQAEGDGSEFTMELVSVEETQSDQTWSSDSSALSSPTLTTVQVDSSLTTVNMRFLSDNDAATRAEHDVGDSATRSSPLLGRYVGQIDARIQRAWLRPRDPVKEGVFSCRARIEQDASGVVNEIILEHCNGDSRWQMSLVHAIQLASPLPAPPDPKVFKRLLRLDFQAQPYSPGAAEELYESPMIAASHPVTPR